MITKILSSIAILFIFSTNLMFSQEINAKVVVNVEQLQSEQRTNISSLDRDLMSYINNQKYLDKKWAGDPIPVEITIYLSGGYNNHYSAKMFIVSKRSLDSPNDTKIQTVSLKLKEDPWSFDYGLGANLSFNTFRFDAFTSVIDYNMLLIIGFELDSYGELDGSPAFDKAKSIVQLGASQGATGFQTNSQPGDFTKYNLMTELTDIRFEDFRKILFSFYNDGMDKLAFDKAKGMKGVQDALTAMAELKKNKLVSSSVLMQLFFDSKGAEIASMFNGYSDPGVFKDLLYLDPSHGIMYDDAKNGKLNQ